MFNLTSPYSTSTGANRKKALTIKLNSEFSRYGYGKRRGLISSVLLRAKHFDREKMINRLISEFLGDNGQTTCILD